MADADKTEIDTEWMTPQERWVWDRVRAGETAYLWDLPEDKRKEAGDGDRDAVTDPMTDGEDGDREPIDEAAWPSWQHLTADFIEHLLCHKAFIAARRRNEVDIEGARIAGSLRLDQADIPGDINLDRCRFDKAPQFLGARISGVFSLQGSHLAAGLVADRLEVGGTVFLRGGARFEGAVRLLGAKIGGDLDCKGSHFMAGADGRALNADRLEVGGTVFLRGGARFEGAVRLPGAKIGSNLECDGSHFMAGADGGALNADGLEVGGDVFLRGAARFEGEVRLVGAKIGSNLECDGSHFMAGAEGRALTADRLEVGGTVFLNGEARFEGGVRLVGAKIGGGLACIGSHFMAGADGGALNADGLEVGGDVFLRGAARFEGEVRLVGAKIGSNLECDGSHFMAGAEGRALTADRLEVGGTVFLNGEARFEGGVRLVGAKIGGGLACIGSHFMAGADGRALNADGLEVGGTVFLRGGARFEGAIDFVGARIGAIIHLSGSRFAGKLDFSGVTVTGEVWLDETNLEMPVPDWVEAAEINLVNARIGALHGSADAWRRDTGKGRANGPFVTLHLDGLKVDRLAGADGGASLDTEDARTIIKWIEKGTNDREGRGFAQGPYVMVANALEASGLLDRARKVRIALEKRKTKDMAWYSPRRWFRQLLSLINAYGYSPYRGLVIAFFGVFLFGVTGYVWSEGSLQTAIETARADWREPFYWLGFSLEQMIPFVDLDPIDDFFLESQFGDGPNRFGYADPSDVPFLVRALFMLESFIGVVILSFSIAGITAWAERRSS